MPRGAYHGSLRDRTGALGATIYQEQLLLPGSAADMLAAAMPADEDLSPKSWIQRAPRRGAPRGGSILRGAEWWSGKPPGCLFGVMWPCGGRVALAHEPQ